MRNYIPRRLFILFCEILCVLFLICLLDILIRTLFDLFSLGAEDPRFPSWEDRLEDWT
jgi:hypothetical protein